MSDLTQQALAALADAGLGNESAAEAFVVGYQAGWDEAFNLAPPTGTPSAKSPNRHGCTRPKRRSQPSTP